MRPAARELVVLLAREAARLALEREAAEENPQNETTRTGDKPVRAGERQREQANHTADPD